MNLRGKIICTAAAWVSTYILYYTFHNCNLDGGPVVYGLMLAVIATTFIIWDA